jgi:hypothetical protein
MDTLTQLAETLQNLFTEIANAVAHETHFVQRHSKLSGATFVQALVFSWLAQPDASYAQLAQTATALGVPLSAQGMAERFSPAAAECLKQLLEVAMQHAICAAPVAIPLLGRFNGVYIQDSTVVTLPDALAHLWRGCGSNRNAHNQAGLKVQVQLNLSNGQLTHLDLQAGRASDRAAPMQTECLPSGALRLADLGYFAIPTLYAYEQQRVFWLTRYYTGCEVVDANGVSLDLVKLLQRTPLDRLDLPIHLSIKHRFPCRLVAQRVSPEAAAARRRKAQAHAQREGITLSEKILTFLDWTLLLTNVPVLFLSFDEVLVLARVRWQIELVFKMWKGQGHLNRSRRIKPYALLCEVYAKLLGVLVQHWLLILHSWQYANRSWQKVAQLVRQHSLSLVYALPSSSALLQVFALFARCCAVGARLNSRKTHPNTVQLLFDVAAFA